MKYSYLVLFTFLLVLSCKKENDQIIENQFDDVFILIKNNSIYAELVNWDSINRNIKDSITQFNSLEDKYRAVDYMISQLPDEHAFFLYPNDTLRFLSTSNKNVPKIQRKVINKTIGYLNIEGFAANDSLSRIYAKDIRDAIIEMDKSSELKGWILDIRNNQGGKTGTFVLGVAPLYTDSIIGYSKTKKDKFIPHKIINNRYHFGEEVTSTVKRPNILKNSQAKIAILVDNNTASSAEFLALSLRSQDNTRVFGQKTAGFTTDLMTYSFVSGAEFGISTSYMCDRDKQQQDTGLVPDVRCSDGEAMDAAIKWINNAI